MCKGPAMQPGTAAEMQNRIVPLEPFCCTPEYTFEELCKLNFSSFSESSPDFMDCGSMTLDVALKQPGSFAGSFDSAGMAYGVVICTTGAPVVEIAEDATAAFHSGQNSQGGQGAVQVPTKCIPRLYSFTQIQAKELLRVRIEFLMANGVPQPPTCPDSPFAGLVPTALHQSTTLADLLHVQSLHAWRVIGFSTPRQYQKLTVERFERDGPALVAHFRGGQLRVAPGSAILTVGEAEEEIPVGTAVASHATELDAAEAQPSFLQRRKAGKAVKVNSWGGALMTSGSFTIMASNMG